MSRTWLLAMAIAAVCSGVVVVGLLLAAHTDMRVPVVYDRDALYALTMFKSVGEGNLPWRNPHLAAPFGGADWRDYPLYQWIDFAAYGFLSLFAHNYPGLLNWYWILTIMATAAIAAYGFLRLRASPLVAGCLAFLYAMQPYIFTRNISHFNLLCYLVPLLAAACVEIAAGRWEMSGTSSWRQIPLYAWMGMVLQGLSFFYFSFFAALLLVVAAFYGACARRTLRPLIHSACLVTVVTGATVVGMSPTLVHWLRHGSNPAAVARSAAEAEVHGLRIRHLLTPVPSHPLPFMRRLSDIAEAKHQDRTEAATTRLGSLGAIGFVALVVYLFAVLAGWRLELDDRIVTACAALLLAAFLWCTVGGFGSVFNTFISPVIRAYDRIIVFLVFFIFAAYGVVVSAVLARKPWARAHPVAVAAGLLLVTTVSFADVLWIPYGIQTQEARQTAASDRAFVSAIERELGGQGMVFQIPYTDFPSGGGPGKIVPLDHARPYYQSTANLRWSWGTVIGTEEGRWMNRVSRLPADSLLAQLRYKGFRGLWIDTYGYAEDPASVPAKAIGAALGQEPLVSLDGRYLFFNLASAHDLPAPPAAGSVAVPFKPAEIHAGGACSVDSIDEGSVSVPSTSVQRTAPFHIEGWVADVDSGIAMPEVYVEMLDAEGKQFYLHGSRYARPDVAQHFNKPLMTQSGFSAVGELGTLPPGSYRVRILQAGSGTVTACPVGFGLELR